MKKVSSLIALIFLVSGILMLNGCKKKPDPPTVTTTAATEVTVTTAKSGGNVTSDGGAEVTARGVCWGTATNPTVAGSKTSNGTGTGSFTSDLTGLTANTTYYVRAYATNSEGTTYGNEVSFTTNPVVGATITTTAAGTITATTAVSGGNITADGGSAITARGVCWSTNANPTTADSKTTDPVGSGTGTFTSNLTALTPGTLYHVRAYATNSAGTSYGNDVTFTTLAVAPTVTTTPVTVFTQTTATAGGNVTATGGAAVTARGVCWSTASAPTIAGSHTTDGEGAGTFTSSLTGLTPGTLYHVRAYATNSVGTSYGDEVTFTTGAVQIGVVTTTSITNFTNISAVAGGSITSNGGGSITASGVCWATTANPDLTDQHTTESATTGAFTSNITGLEEGTIYYVRAYVTNSAGTAFGNQVQILTRMSDVEGTIYNTVAIGTQIWMAENLQTITFNNNNDIPLVTDAGEWIALTTPAYCWYDNNEAVNKELYGALYNWFAASSANLCPTGWHVPTDTEFKTLEMFLGMTQAQADGFSWRGTDEGTQLKSATGWDVAGGTNTSGFSALPGGFRYYGDGSFFNEGVLSYWWSASEVSAANAYYRRLNGDNAGVFREGAVKTAGKYVRCLKD